MIEVDNKTGEAVNTDSKTTEKKAAPKAAKKPAAKADKKPAAKKAEKKAEKKELSNKAVVYLLFSQKGVEDIDKLHKKVNEQVQAKTIKNWISQWKKGKNLPAIAKEYPLS